MKLYLSHLWDDIKASFWLLPTFMVFGAFLLSMLTLTLDRKFEGREGSFFAIWEGGAEGARQLLSTIAGSLITITGVVFSITIVALALTSTQFGSRLLRTFIKDMGTQFVLGIFIATSIYALLILRTIKNEPSSFIPNISISMSLALGILSLSLLIYFIHHLSVRVQAPDIVVRVAYDLISTIEGYKNLDHTSRSASTYERVCHEKVFSQSMGYLQVIDYQKLIDLAKNNQFVIEIDLRPGHFVRKEMVLAMTNSSKLKEDLHKSIANAFVIGKERSPIQDIEYAIDQLVIIALRALGLNVNDTFTANSCIDHLGAALCLLCNKDLSPFNYEPNPYVMLISNQVAFEGLVDACFNQIRQFGSSNPSVLIHILETLTSILDCTKTTEHRKALIKHAEMIHECRVQLIEEIDRKDLEERFQEFIGAFEKGLNKVVGIDG